MKRKSRLNILWIVEMYLASKSHANWLPTTGIALSRSDGRREILDWKKANPYDKFRLRKYGAMR